MYLAIMIGTGCSCLGLLIGGLVALFEVETERFNLSALSGAVSIFGGTGVIAIFNLLGGIKNPPAPEYWLYPVGLLLGAVIVALIKGKI
jgi:peptidoglycan/LPS O-acetylase OafA/YrhL